MNKYTLIFLHIPKTGGVTLQSIIRKQFLRGPLLEVGVVKGKVCYEKFDQMCEKGQIECQVLMGHLQFGVGRFLTLPAKYITMLRDPVNRYISQYYDILKKKRYPCNKFLRRKVIADFNDYSHLQGKSIEYFVRSNIGDEYANLQTRYLCSIDNKTFVNRDFLEIAKKNLKYKIECFGLLERFDESMLLLKKFLGLKNIYYIKKNVTTERMIVAPELSSKTVELIKEKNRYDIELYSFAQELFEEKINNYGTDFLNDLKNYRLLNKLYKYVMYPSNSIHYKLRRRVATLKNPTKLIKFRKGFYILKKKWSYDRLVYHNIYFCCTQKTASQWLKRFLKDDIIQRYLCFNVYDYKEYREEFLKIDFPMGIPLVEVSNKVYKGHKISIPLPNHTIGATLYIGYKTYKSIPKPANYKTFFIMRDPRDIIVSWYFSTLYSHKETPDIKKHRKVLPELGLTDGFKYAIDFLIEIGLFEGQISWTSADLQENERIFYYHDLANSYDQFLIDLLNFLEIKIPKGKFALLQEKHKFEKYSNGRIPGEEDLFSHYRKGIVGDWENYFSDEIKAYFMNKLGDILERLKYKPF